MLWHAAIFLALVGGFVFNKNDACVISTQSCSHVQPTQPVPKINSSPQSSPVFSMLGSSIEAISPLLTSTYFSNGITSLFSSVKSSPETTSTRFTDSVTPSCTMVIPSQTMSINGTNCRKATPAMEDKLKNLIKKLEGKTAAEVIEHFEGKRKKVYNDKKKPSGKKTVGIGFNMEQGAYAREIWKKALPTFDDVLSGKRCLDDAEIKKLFQHTLKNKTAEAKRLFPKYDTYPKYVKTALLNGVFRGDFKKGHKTVKLINKGKWDKVPGEYIRRDDFDNCISDRLGGLWYRLKWNAHIFKKYADELKQN